jgi:hypothetical protein
MNTDTIKARLRHPDTIPSSEYRLVHDALIDMLDSWDAAADEDVSGFVVEVLIQMRRSITKIASDAGLLGTIVNIEHEHAVATSMAVVEDDTKYQVVWDNGHASGVLPGVFDTEDDAEVAGREWWLDMQLADPEAFDADGESDVYGYEIVDTNGHM